ENTSPDGRKGVEALSSVSFDGPDQLLGVAAVRQYDFLPRQPGTEGTRPARHVEERKHANERAARELGHGGKGAQHRDAVGQLYGLGLPGRATGEEHDMTVGLPGLIAIEAAGDHGVNQV